MNKDTKTRLISRTKTIMATKFNGIKPYFNEAECIFQIPFADYRNSQEIQNDVYTLVSYLPFNGYKWVMFIKVYTDNTATMYLKQVFEGWLC